MSGAQTMATLRRHRWPLAFLVIVVAGYGLGKDLALRDNARDASLMLEQGA